MGSPSTASIHPDSEGARATACAIGPATIAEAELSEVAEVEVSEAEEAEVRDASLQIQTHPGHGPTPDPEVPELQEQWHCQSSGIRYGDPIWLGWPLTLVQCQAKCEQNSECSAVSFWSN